MKFPKALFTKYHNFSDCRVGHISTHKKDEEVDFCKKCGDQQIITEVGRFILKRVDRHPLIELLMGRQYKVFWELTGQRVRPLPEINVRHALRYEWFEKSYTMKDGTVVPCSRMTLLLAHGMNFSEPLSEMNMYQLSEDVTNSELERLKGEL